MVALSIIIPTFNRAALLERAIRSCVGASRRHFEVVVVDDGSTDDIRSVVTRAAADLDARYFQHPSGVNLGVSASRNLGFERSRGQYVSFLDSDDELLPARFESALDLLESCPTINAVWDEVAVRELDGRTWAHSYMSGHSEPLVPGYYRHAQCRVPPTLGLTIRRSTMARLLPFDTSKRVGEDYEVWLRVLHGEACAFSAGSHPTAIIHKHRGNTEIGSVPMVELRSIADARRWFQKAGNLAAASALRVRFDATLYHYISEYRDGDRRSRKTALGILRAAARLRPEMLLGRPYWANVFRLLLRSGVVSK